MLFVEGHTLAARYCDVHAIVTSPANPTCERRLTAAVCFSREGRASCGEAVETAMLTLEQHAGMPPNRDHAVGTNARGAVEGAIDGLEKDGHDGADDAVPFCLSIPDPAALSRGAPLCQALCAIHRGAVEAVPTPAPYVAVAAAAADDTVWGVTMQGMVYARVPVHDLAAQASSAVDAAEGQDDGSAAADASVPTSVRMVPLDHDMSEDDDDATTRSDNRHQPPAEAHAPRHYAWTLVPPSEVDHAAYTLRGRSVPPTIVDHQQMRAVFAGGRTCVYAITADDEDAGRLVRREGFELADCVRGCHQSAILNQHRVGDRWVDCSDDVVPVPAHVLKRGGWFPAPIQKGEPVSGKSSREVTIDGGAVDGPMTAWAVHPSRSPYLAADARQYGNALLAAMQAQSQQHTTAGASTTPSPAAPLSPASSHAASVPHSTILSGMKRGSQRQDPVIRAMLSLRPRQFVTASVGIDGSLFAVTEEEVLTGPISPFAEGHRALWSRLWCRDGSSITSGGLRWVEAPEPFLGLERDRAPACDGAAVAALVNTERNTDATAHPPAMRILKLAHTVQHELFALIDLWEAAAGRRGITDPDAGEDRPSFHDPALMTAIGSAFDPRRQGLLFQRIGLSVDNMTGDFWRRIVLEPTIPRGLSAGGDTQEKEVQGIGAGVEDAIAEAARAPLRHLLWLRDFGISAPTDADHCQHNGLTVEGEAGTGTYAQHPSFSAALNTAIGITSDGAAVVNLLPAMERHRAQQCVVATTLDAAVVGGNATVGDLRPLPPNAPVAECLFARQASVAAASVMAGELLLVLAKATHVEDLVVRSGPLTMVPIAEAVALASSPPDGEEHEGQGKEGSGVSDTARVGLLQRLQLIPLSSELHADLPHRLALLRHRTSLPLPASFHGAVQTMTVDHDSNGRVSAMSAVIAFDLDEECVTSSDEEDEEGHVDGAARAALEAALPPRRLWSRQPATLFIELVAASPMEGADPDDAGVPSFLCRVARLSVDRYKIHNGVPSEVLPSPEPGFHAIRRSDPVTALISRLGGCDLDSIEERRRFERFSPTSGEGTGQTTTDARTTWLDERHEPLLRTVFPCPGRARRRHVHAAITIDMINDNNGDGAQQTITHVELLGAHVRVLGLEPLPTAVVRVTLTHDRTAGLAPSAPLCALVVPLPPERPLRSLSRLFAVARNGGDGDTVLAAQYLLRTERLRMALFGGDGCPTRLVLTNGPTGVPLPTSSISAESPPLLLASRIEVPGGAHLLFDVPSTLVGSVSPTMAAFADTLFQVPPASPSPTSDSASLVTTFSCPLTRRHLVGDGDSNEAHAAGSEGGAVLPHYHPHFPATGVPCAISSVATRTCSRPRWATLQRPSLAVLFLHGHAQCGGLDDALIAAAEAATTDRFGYVLDSQGDTTADGPSFVRLSDAAVLLTLTEEGDAAATAVGGGDGGGDGRLRAILAAHMAVHVEHGGCQALHVDAWGSFAMPADDFATGTDAAPLDVFGGTFQVGVGEEEGSAAAMSIEVMPPQRPATDSGSAIVVQSFRRPALVFSGRTACEAYDVASHAGDVRLATIVRPTVEAEWVLAPPPAGARRETDVLLTKLTLRPEPNDAGSHLALLGHACDAAADARTGPVVHYTAAAMDALFQSAWAIAGTSDGTTAGDYCMSARDLLDSRELRIPHSAPHAAGDEDHLAPVSLDALLGQLFEWNRTVEAGHAGPLVVGDDDVRARDSETSIAFSEFAAAQKLTLAESALLQARVGAEADGRARAAAILASIVPRCPPSGSAAAFVHHRTHTDAAFQRSLDHDARHRHVAEMRAAPQTWHVETDPPQGEPLRYNTPVALAAAGPFAVPPKRQLLISVARSLRAVDVDICASASDASLEHAYTPAALKERADEASSGQRSLECALWPVSDDGKQTLAVPAGDEGGPVWVLLPVESSMESPSDRVVCDGDVVKVMCFRPSLPAYDDDDPNVGTSPLRLRDHDAQREAEAYLCPGHVLESVTAWRIQRFAGANTAPSMPDDQTTTDPREAPDEPPLRFIGASGAEEESDIQRMIRERAALRSKIRFATDPVVSGAAEASRALAEHLERLRSKNRPLSVGESFILVHPEKVDARAVRGTVGLAVEEAPPPHLALSIDSISILRHEQATSRRRSQANAGLPEQPYHIWRALPAVFAPPKLEHLKEAASAKFALHTTGDLRSCRAVPVEVFGQDAWVHLRVAAIQESDLSVPADAAPRDTHSIAVVIEGQFCHPLPLGGLGSLGLGTPSGTSLGGAPPPSTGVLPTTPLSAVEGALETSRPLSARATATTFPSGLAGPHFSAFVRHACSSYDTQPAEPTALDSTSQGDDVTRACAAERRAALPALYKDAAAWESRFTMNGCAVTWAAEDSGHLKTSHPAEATTHHQITTDVTTCELTTSILPDSTPGAAVIAVRVPFPTARVLGVRLGAELSLSVALRSATAARGLGRAVLPQGSWLWEGATTSLTAKGLRLQAPFGVPLPWATTVQSIAMAAPSTFHDIAPAVLLQAAGSPAGGEEGDVATQEAAVTSKAFADHDEPFPSFCRAECEKRLETLHRRQAQLDRRARDLLHRLHHTPNASRAHRTLYQAQLTELTNGDIPAVVQMIATTKAVLDAATAQEKGEPAAAVAPAAITTTSSSIVAAQREGSVDPHSVPPWAASRLVKDIHKGLPTVTEGSSTAASSSVDLVVQNAGAAGATLDVTLNGTLIKALPVASAGSYLII